MVSSNIYIRAVTVVLCFFVTFGSAQTAATQGTLAEQVTPQGIRAHMAALQRVADVNEGNRAAGTPGYAASVRYAEKTFREAGYRVRRQPFTVTVTETLAETGHVLGGEALTLNVMAGSPNTVTGGLTAPLMRPKDPLGCAAETGRQAGIQNKLRGAVLLIKRGSCTFAEKSQNAAQAGAVAALIYNDEQDGFPLFGSLGDVSPAAVVPTAGLAQTTGERLVERLERETVRVGLELRTSRTTQRTANVIAELPGETKSVVMVGAHLDSVPEGPGINDNGSGVGLVLELAQQLARTGEAKGIRFALWGAEELGLLGSEHYVSSLSPADLGSIRAYLNFDMVSSPNAAPFVYGDSALTGLFAETFTAQGLELLPDAVGGRSDHAPFEAAGVPVAGLFSGAEGLKSAGVVERYGGNAAPYDTCYHRACDTLRGSSTLTATRYLDLLADAAADALQRLISENACQVGSGVCRPLRRKAYTDLKERQC